MDVAGNDMATDFSVPDGSKLKQTSAVQIDGIYPDDFTISYMDRWFKHC